ncbi:cell division protein FtsL [Paenibacillus koleovorans]|uniref:cell division protein FtsL n=1 Tax=Paenibacillus koleovorans TaxID=121608 RepID=UPI000FD7289F|nr:cell division protein FtsL [Paenibacillus koleovorans]
MSAYIHGNLALEPKETRKQQVKETKKTVYRRRPIPVQEKLLYLFTVLVCVVVAGVIIWRYAQIYEMNTRIQMIEKEVKMLQVENNKLKLEISKAQDPKRLQDLANQYGLGPHEDQVNQVNTNTQSASKKTDPKSGTGKDALAMKTE